MINGKRILAIVPARAGSKRLPGKNIKPLAGKPLIQWSIDTANSSLYLDTVMVSTDCMDIATIAKNCNAEVPYIRSAELSDDTATSLDVVLDVLRYYEGQHQFFDLVLLLQPTSPLRSVDDINKAIEYFEKKNAAGVISVTECEHSPLWCNVLPENNAFDNFIQTENSVRSQDLPTYHRLNGAIYLFDVNSVMINKCLLPTRNSFAFIMANENSIDIDTQLDFTIAEALLLKDISC